MGLREIISRLSVRGPVAEVAERLRLEAGRVVYMYFCRALWRYVLLSRSLSRPVVDLSGPNPTFGGGKKIFFGVFDVPNLT